MVSDPTFLSPSKMQSGITIQCFEKLKIKQPHRPATGCLLINILTIKFLPSCPSPCVSMLWEDNGYYFCISHKVPLRVIQQTERYIKEQDGGSILHGLGIPWPELVLPHWLSWTQASRWTNGDYLTADSHPSAPSTRKQETGLHSISAGPESQSMWPDFFFFSFDLLLSLLIVGRHTDNMVVYNEDLNTFREELHFSSH